jgi:hypothetical protein
MSDLNPVLNRIAAALEHLAKLAQDKRNWLDANSAAASARKEEKLRQLAEREAESLKGKTLRSDDSESFYI